MPRFQTKSFRQYAGPDRKARIKENKCFSANLLPLNLHLIDKVLPLH
jgi:hypothetical protein